MKNSILLLALAAVFLQLGCGYSKPGNTQAVAGTVPVVSQLVPANVTHGAASFTLTINGSSFNSNAVVNWNGAALTTTFVTGNQLTAAVPAASVASAGSVSVTVTNPGMSGNPYGGTLDESSTAMTFTIN
ncbi:MAG TPA: IPT/TIG domain-containing protein [Terriglobales bacterium]|nr:IPT/TIG domain-containing protein [Terriglobales bacterium]